MDSLGLPQTPQSSNSTGASGTLALADRQLGRSVVFVFVLAGIVAVLGPLLSYRSDLGQLQDLFRQRIARESQADASTLGRHLVLLQSELERLADRPEVNLLDASMQPERELLDSAHRQSTLFDSGVAIFDAAGTLVWSEPATLKAEGISGGRWFTQMQATRGPITDLAVAGRPEFLVAVPILRDRKVTGALVGVSRAMRSALSPTLPDDPVVRILEDANGNVTMPDNRPTWASEPDFISGLRALPGTQGPLQLSSGVNLYAWVTRVAPSGASLIEVGNEELVASPVRYRFQLQMMLLLSLQIGAVLLLSLFLRRTYGRFLVLERKSQENERLFALGSAASLIAHEVKNSLNGLQAATTLLSSGPLAREDSETALSIKSIRGEVDRLKHLASSLLLFGKPAAVQLQETHLPQLVREVVDSLVLPEVDEAKIDLDLPNDLRVSCDPLLLTTAVHNLVRNAVEAAVAAKDLGKVAAPRIMVRVATQDGAATVEVEDNAGGVDSTVASRLFEPFSTGKPKGIGLGLSMTRRAMEAQGGTVSYERIKGGSRFVLRLPDAKLAPPTSQRYASDARHGGVQ